MTPAHCREVGDLSGETGGKAYRLHHEYIVGGLVAVETTGAADCVEAR